MGLSTKELDLNKIFQNIQDQIIAAIDFKKDENVIEDLIVKTEIPPEYLK